MAKKEQILSTIAQANIYFAANCFNGLFHHCCFQSLHIGLVCSAERDCISESCFSSTDIWCNAIRFEICFTPWFSFLPSFAPSAHLTSFLHASYHHWPDNLLAAVSPLHTCLLPSFCLVA